MARKSLPPKLRREIFDRDGYRCQICGQEVEFFRPLYWFTDSVLGHIDHIIPISRGGSDDPENLRLLCEPCNLAKKDKTDEEWLHADP